MTREQRQKSADRQAQQMEALGRAQGGASARNDALIILGFMAIGINDAQPRIDCFTYNAWQAKGRQVKRRPGNVEKGKYGVSIPVWIPIAGKTDPETGKPGEKKLRPKSATVFHISQTEPIERNEALSA